MKLKANLVRNMNAVLLFVGLLLVDQVTKYLATTLLGVGGEFKVIPGIFHLTYLRNQGAAWGILQGHFVLFAIITFIVVAGLIFYYIRIPNKKEYRLLSFTVILIIAGAIGNFIDRLLYRYVVDFFYFKAINFPIFNVADIYVSIAAMLLAYCVLIRYKDEDLIWKKKK